MQYSWGVKSRKIKSKKTVCLQVSWIFTKAYFEEVTGQGHTSWKHRCVAVSIWQASSVDGCLAEVWSRRMGWAALFVTVCNSMGVCQLKGVGKTTFQDEGVIMRSPTAVVGSRARRWEGGNFITRAAREVLNLASPPCTLTSSWSVAAWVSVTASRVTLPHVGRLTLASQLSLWIYLSSWGFFFSSLESAISHVFFFCTFGLALSRESAREVSCSEMACLKTAVCPSAG